MRLLTLSQVHVPEPEPKVHLLARDLARRGHEVTSITAFPNYPLGRIYDGYRQRPWSHETMDGVDVIRLPIFPDHSGSGIRRALHYFSFAASATGLGTALGGRADVLWVYHPPLTLGIPALARRLVRHVPFVYEIQDMWPETVLASGMTGSRAVEKGLRSLARRVYRKAAAITVISPGFRANLIAKGVPAEKIHVIPNWADEDLYRPLPHEADLAESTGMAGKFNIVYAGNMGPAQALGNVLDAAELLHDLRDVQLVMIGDGVDHTRLVEDAARRGLDNVRFLGRMPAREMPRYYALADALLVHLKRDPLFEMTIPHKTLGYLACGRPILAAVAGDPADVVREAGAGPVVPPEDPRALADAIRELHALPVSSREKLGESGRAAYLAKYTRAVLVERYERLFEDVAAHGV